MTCPPLCRTRLRLQLLLSRASAQSVRPLLWQHLLHARRIGSEPTIVTSHGYKTHI